MVQSFVEDIPASRFTDATIRRMYELVDRSKTDANFQKLIAGVVNGSMRGQWKQYHREAQVLLSWVKRTVDYRRDPVNVELLQDPWRTLDVAKGDCDDMSVLLAAALETMGIPTHFVTVSTKPDGEPSHVYIEAWLDGRWVPMDPIVKASIVGWAPGHGITAKRVWSRPDVGLAGGGDIPVEGLGMDWTNDAILARRGTSPLRLDEISHTRANPWPGEAFRSGQPGWTPPVARFADTPGLPLPGDFDRYSVRRQIQSNPTPAQLNRFVPYSSPPFDLASMTGAVPTWKEQPNAMLPHHYSDSDPSLHSDLSGLGENVAHSLLRNQRLLQIAIRNETKRKMMEEARKINRIANLEHKRLRDQIHDLRVAAAKTNRPINVRFHGLGGLGADAAPVVQPTTTDVTKVSTAVSSAVTTGEVPKQPTLISQAIDLAVGLWSAKQASAAAAKLASTQAAVTAQAAVTPPAPAATGGSPWLVPAGIAAALIAFGGVLK